MTVYHEYGEITNIQMMPDEIDHMVEQIRAMPRDGLIVEWGSGGSSAKWLETMTPEQTLISIEHNREWFEKVVKLQDMFPDKCFSPLFVDVSNPYYQHGYGDIAEENPFNVALYVYPDYRVFDADIYFIDGIVRGACLASVLLNQRKNAVMYIHDYTPRVISYNWITQFCHVEIVGTTLAKITKL